MLTALLSAITRIGRPRTASSQRSILRLRLRDVARIQSFNTITSMGRLTLNVLLSFAQFEREVTGERIRDKIAASKRKGLWMGGPVPLGYDVVDRQLVINKSEAATVRHIMKRYIHIGSIRDLACELATAGVRTKQRKLRDGSIVGGVPFSRGGLSHLLNNCVYVGHVRHKGEVFDGAHDAIIDQATWQQVQTLLADQTPVRQRAANIRHPSLLAGLLYDGHGRRMTPSHAVKQVKRYRYYMTQHVERGSSTAWRVPAFDLEQLVVARLCRHVAEDASTPDHRNLSEHDDHQHASRLLIAELTEGADSTRAAVIASLVSRIDVNRDRLQIHLIGEAAQILEAAATLVRSGRQTRLVPPGVQAEGTARRDDALIKLIASAHAARMAVENAHYRSLADVAQDHGYTLHYFSQLARLGGLAPNIVTAIIDGRQPAALTRTRLARTKALPTDWAEQRRMFGFA